MPQKRGSYARRATESKRDELRERERHERWTATAVGRGCDGFWNERGVRQPHNRWRQENEHEEAY